MVYDLTVEDQPEFFANGILVHNSAESIRYGAMSRPTPAPKPEQRDLTLEGRVQQQLEELAHKPQYQETYW